MTDKALVKLGQTMARLGIVSTLIGWVWVIGMGRAGLLFDEWLVFNGTAAIGLGAIALYVLPRQPRNWAVWPSVIGALTSGLFCLTSAAAFQISFAQGLTLEELYSLAPSDFETGTALLVMMASWLHVPVFLVFTAGTILFPDGTPPSPRWRWVVYVSYGAGVLQSAGLIWLFRPSSTVPISAASSATDFLVTLGPVVTISEISIMAMIVTALAGMIVRFRRSIGVERQQFRVVLWGAVAASVLIFLSVAVEVTELLDSRWLALLLIVVLIGSYGLAMAKYRLYDVDVVISRSLVFASLAVFIAAVYVGVVVGLGLLVDPDGESGIWLGIAATVLVAMAFQPVRRSLERLANRLVYGRRATPYEVLSSFSQEVAAVDPDVLQRIARSLCEGTTATGVAIWIRRGADMHRITSWPGNLDVPATLKDGSSPVGIDRRFEIVHDDETVGLLGLVLAPGQPFPPTDEKLILQIVSGMGLAIRNLLLTDDLQARVDQLRESRKRIVAVQDQTRQMLERDLHDGAQQRLVALKIKVGLGAAMAQKEGLEDVKQVLDTVKAEADLTIDSLRTLARGIYPPLLEAEGLGAALSAQLNRVPFPVTVQAAGLGRYPRDVESTVYFCVLEAVQNAVKHSQGNSVLVTLSDLDGELTFEVRDDGIGFDPDSTGEGHGLVNITDRLDAADGRVEIKTSPGHGTSINGRIPIGDRVVV